MRIRESWCFAAHLLTGSSGDSPEKCTAETAMLHVDRTAAER